MEMGVEEEKPMLDGFPCRFYAHEQKVAGHDVATYAHYHDYIEILYCTQGAYDIWLNGRYYHFSQGDLVLINSREVHLAFGVGDGENCYTVLRFEPEILYSSFQNIYEVRYMLPFILNDTTPQKVFRREEIEKTCIPGLVQEALREFQEKEYGYELAVRSHICQMFLWILRYWKSLGIDLDYNLSNCEQMLPKFQVILDYSKQHYAEHLTAEEMARQCNFSYSYFSRSFKRIMKRSYTDYLNYIRISEAEKLLLTTDRTVTEIALQVGFASSSHFIQQFRRHKDISPLQFKKAFTGREKHEIKGGSDHVRKDAGQGEEANERGDFCIYR